MHWDLAVVIGNVAFATSAAAFLVRDMLWLRLLSVAGNIASVAAILVVGVRPAAMPSMAWLALFLAINLVQSIRLILERLDHRLTAEDEDLRAAAFPQLSVGEFRMLLRLGRRRSAREGEVLGRQGEHLEDVLLVEKGELMLLRNGASVARRQIGEMVGEVAFVTQRPLTTSAVAGKDVQLVVWSRDTLRKLFTRRPTIALGFQGAFISRSAPGS